MIISFPRKQVNDFTLEKYKDAQTSPTMYGDRGATWDVNPQYDPTHPLFKDFPWVTIEALNIRIPKPFVEEFLKDPTDCKSEVHVRAAATDRWVLRDPHEAGRVRGP